MLDGEEEVSCSSLGIKRQDYMSVCLSELWDKTIET